MNNALSCLTANFIGRHPGYPMGRAQWTRYQEENEAFFRPRETFRERFDALAGDIQALGFDAVDLWFGTLNPEWANAEYADDVKAVLARRGMKIASLFGNVGDTPADAARACALANALGCRLLTGDCPALEGESFDEVCALFRERGVRFALVNRLEKTPEALNARIRGGIAGVVGACVDTGAFAVHGYPAQDALEKLSGNLMYVHFKDVKNQGLLQQCCRFGQGLVNLPACARALEKTAYKGGVSIVNTALAAAPDADLKSSLDMARAWLG